MVCEPVAPGTRADGVVWALRVGLETRESAADALVERVTGTTTKDSDSVGASGSTVKISTCEECIWWLKMDTHGTGSEQVPRS